MYKYIIIIITRTLNSCTCKCKSCSCFTEISRKFSERRITVLLRRSARSNRLSRKSTDATPSEVITYRAPCRNVLRGPPSDPRGRAGSKVDQWSVRRVTVTEVSRSLWSEQVASVYWLCIHARHAIVHSIARELRRSVATDPRVTQCGGRLRFLAPVFGTIYQWRFSEKYLGGGLAPHYLGGNNG